MYSIFFCQWQEAKGNDLAIQTSDWSPVEGDLYFLRTLGKGSPMGFLN
jgi:hypothetical protein